MVCLLPGKKEPGGRRGGVGPLSWEEAASDGANSTDFQQVGDKAEQATKPTPNESLDTVGMGEARPAGGAGQCCRLVGEDGEFPWGLDPFGLSCG